MAKVTDKQILKAIESSAGFLTVAAKKVGMTYQGVWCRIKKSKKLKDAVEQIQESRLDLSESELMAAIQAGEAWAVCFHLKCKGKKRGYVERHEVTGQDGGAIKQTVEIVFVDGKDKDKDSQIL